MTVQPKPDWSNRSVFIASVALLGFSVIRGVRLPNSWSATHLVLSYDHGFIKRGLLGSLFEWLALPGRTSFGFFATLSFVVFAAWLALLIWQLRDFACSRNLDAVAAAFVYVSSLGVVFLAHAVGYWEHLGILLSLIALRISHFFPRLWFVGISFGIAILIHEAIFVIFYPVLFAAMLMQSSKVNRIHRLSLGVVTAGLAGLTWFVSQATISADKAALLHRELQALADYELNQGVFWVLSQDAHSNLATMRAWWKQPSSFYVLCASFAISLPAIVLLLGLAVRRAKALSHDKALPVICVFGLSPMTLHFLGWDIDRWNTLAITTSFLVFVAVHRAFPDPPPVEARSRAGTLLPLAVVLIVLGVGSETIFFEGHVMRSFPFRKELECLAEAVAGDSRCLK